MTDVRYVDQSADALRLTVLRGRPDRSSLNILCEDERTLPGGEVLHAGIIGESHFFSLHLGDDRTLTEVFACTEPAADNRMAFIGPLDHVQGGLSLILFHTMRYTFTPHRGKIDAWSDEITRLEAKVADYGKDAKKKHHTIGLAYTFPGEGRHKAQTLLTVSWVSAPQFRSLSVNSCHVYPNHGDAVFTRTHIKETRR